MSSCCSEIPSFNKHSGEWSREKQTLTSGFGIYVYSHTLKQVCIYEHTPQTGWHANVLHILSAVVLEKLFSKVIDNVENFIIYS